jgi:hypothetical protein
MSRSSTFSIPHPWWGGKNASERPNGAGDCPLLVNREDGGVCWAIGAPTAFAYVLALVESYIALALFLGLARKAT